MKIWGLEPVVTGLCTDSLDIVKEGDRVAQLVLEKVSWLIAMRILVLRRSF